MPARHRKRLQHRQRQRQPLLQRWPQRPLLRLRRRLTRQRRRRAPARDRAPITDLALDLDLVIIQVSHQPFQCPLPTSSPCRARRPNHSRRARIRQLRPSRSHHGQTRQPPVLHLTVDDATSALLDLARIATASATTTCPAHRRARAAQRHSTVPRASPERLVHARTTMVFAASTPTRCCIDVRLAVWSATPTLLPCHPRIVRVLRAHRTQVVIASLKAPTSASITSR